MATTQESKRTTEQKAMKTVNEYLQQNLLDLLLLSLQVKQAHWNIVGPQFLPIHQFLDKVYDEVQEAIDETAERIRQLAGFPNGNASLVAANKTLEPMPEGKIVDAEVVRLMSAKIHTLIDAFRDRLEPLEDMETVTADMIHHHVHHLEEFAWMLDSMAQS